MESIYGEYKDYLPVIMENICKIFREFNDRRYKETGCKAYEHLSCRIKAEESMREKCQRKGLEESPYSALHELKDAIGIRAVCGFVDDIYAFVNDHPEYELHRYNDILAMNGIDWSNKSMEEADVAGLDGKAVMALLVGMLRADRFCEGAMFGFLKSGKVKEWLLRLKEIDMQYQDEK